MQLYKMKLCPTCGRKPRAKRAPSAYNNFFARLYKTTECQAIADPRERVKFCAAEWQKHKKQQTKKS